MKLLNYLLVVSLFFTACKKETKEEAPVLPADYGSGMYIVTENGISFYNNNVVQNKIYHKVNGRSILNAKKIKFHRSKAYIVTDNEILTVNIETFENKESRSILTKSSEGSRKLCISVFSLRAIIVNNGTCFRLGHLIVNGIFTIQNREFVRFLKF